MLLFLKNIFRVTPRGPHRRTVKKVKHSDRPALTYAHHGTVLLKGKIEEIHSAK
ncbi:hypothetical protein [Paenibacillus gansuensis]|uniref:Uncharacterized protein n=1 Tax=Paenibacillus gansuensis TaxID=306542 RepID=A0ABW5PA97_9BACL